MSLESYPLLRISDEAASSLTAKTCAAVNSSGQLTAAAANGADFAGAIVENDGASSAPYFANLQTHGIAVLLSDGTTTIDEGNLVTVGSSGKIKSVTPATGTNLRGTLVLTEEPQG